MKAEKLTRIRTKGFLWLPERLGISLLVVLTEFNVNGISHHDHQIVENKQTRNAAKRTGVSNNVVLGFKTTYT